MSQNRSKVTLRDGTTLYHSYKTLVGFWSPKIADFSRIPVFTDEKYSSTTSRHIRTFIKEDNGTVVPWQAWELLRDEAGL